LIASLLLPVVLALLTSACSAPPPAPIAGADPSDPGAPAPPRRHRSRPPPPPAIAGADPSDPGARAPRVDYRSTLGSYKSQRPVEPGPWGEQNQSVAPQPKSGHEGHR